MLRRSDLRTWLLAAALVVLSACMTGERPSVLEGGPPSENLDPAVTEVLALLESGSDADRPSEARYDVLRKFGNTRTEAVLARDRDRWSLTVGDVRYLDLGGSRATCDLITGRCDPGFDEARVSDVLTTIRFAELAPATRLRRDASTSSGPVSVSRPRIAGLRATCAQLPQPGGTSVYCANDLGLLALQDTADVRIELLAVDDLVDPSLYDTTGAPG